MNKAQLEHILISAANIGDDNEIIVIGSQSVLGQFPEAAKNPVLSHSMEADLYLRNKLENTIRVEGAIGEGSMFHQTYGYYAQEVSPRTAILPKGWENRLIPVRAKYKPGTYVTGYCLEAHDLAVAKYAAGREKDYIFIAVMINKGMLRKKELIKRVYSTKGINYHSIICKIKRDFNEYASKSHDFNKLYGKPAIKPAPMSDKDKARFVEQIRAKGKIV